VTDPRISPPLTGRALPPGGTIGVCAPSGPYYNASDVLRPKEWWESKGFRVKLTDGVWARDDYEAGPAEKRAEDLLSLFTDPEVDVIQVLWGGTGAIHLLPLLDYALIQANPKALMGYSDITNLHVALRQEAGLVTLHGPGLGSMGYSGRTTFTWDSASDAFTRGATGQVPDDPDDPYRRTLAPGSVTAPIVGGNLFTLVHLLGTPFEPVFDGAILFLEEVHEPAYVIEIHLTQLRMAGKLEGVLGVVVGELAAFYWSEAQPEAPERHLAPLGVPVLYRLPLGHGKHLATIPLGVTATLDADGRSLTIGQPGVLSSS
jgi:muramoyltetrapeptide carboxypeptidase